MAVSQSFHHCTSFEAVVPEAKIQHGFKMTRKIHKQNPYGKIVIDEILREFSPLHVFSCSAPRRQKYNMGSKLAEKNHEQDPCHRILIDGILREILPPKENRPTSRKSLGTFYKVKWSRSGTFGVFLALE
jgi:hypothetical protein